MADRKEIPKKLTPEQFQLDENGNILVHDDALTDVIESQTSAEESIPQWGIGPHPVVDG